MTTIQSLPPAPPQAPVPYQPIYTPPPNRNRMIAIAAAVAVALIAVTVIVVMAVTGGGNGGGSGGGSVAAPTGVHIVAKTATSATVAWNPIAQQPSVYRVYRNSTLLTSVPGTSVQYRDTGLTPSTAYSYAVSAVVNGKESARSAPIGIQTATPTLASARLDGSYDVRYRVTSEGGYTQIAPGDTTTASWWFDRRSSGRTVLNGESWSGAGWSMPLVHNGQVYSGQTHAGISQCDFKTVNTAISVKLRIVKAAMVNNVWTATRFTGRLSQVAPYTTAGIWTCPGAHFNASLVGNG